MKLKNSPTLLAELQPHAAAADIPSAKVIKSTPRAFFLFSFLAGFQNVPHLPRFSDCDPHCVSAFTGDKETPWPPAPQRGEAVTASRLHHSAWSLDLLRVQAFEVTKLCQMWCRGTRLFRRPWTACVSALVEPPGGSRILDATLGKIRACECCGGLDLNERKVNCGYIDCSL